MSEAMTYSSLINDVQVYAERNDPPFVTQIPRFVMLAENRIAAEVKGLGYTRFVAGNLTQAASSMAKPARWRETASMSITSGGSVVGLKQRAYTFCRSYWPNQTLVAQPKYYSDYGYEHILIVPTPDDDYAFEMSYFERPLPLDDSNQTNWTTQYAPQLLLYGTLLEAQPFLKRPERTAEFQALFDRAASAVTNESQRRLMGDQSIERTGIQ